MKQLADVRIYFLTFQELCDATVADALVVSLWHDLGTKKPHLNLILCTLEDIARGVTFIHSKNIIHGNSHAAFPQYLCLLLHCTTALIELGRKSSAHHSVPPHARR